MFHFISNNKLFTRLFMNGDFPIQFSVYTKLSHTPCILCLRSLFRIQNGGLTTQHHTEKRRESFLIWPIFERNFTIKWVKVSIFHLILYFFMIRDDPSRSDPDWRSKLIWSDFCTCLIAAAHKSVAALKKNLESLMAKRRRLEAKVIFLYLIERFFMH